MFCSKCNINWAQLHTQEVENEIYEYCPVCKTDVHLQPQKNSVKFIMCPITGKVRNLNTGKVLLFGDTKPPKIIQRSKPVNIDEYRKRHEDRIKKEDKAIEAYLSTYQTHGLEAARKVFFEQSK